MALMAGLLFDAFASPSRNVSAYCVSNISILSLISKVNLKHHNYRYWYKAARDILTLKLILLGCCALLAKFVDPTLI